MKKNIFLYLLNKKKRNSFHLVRQIARNPGFLLIIGWGESGKVILQVSIAVFQMLSKKFSGKDGSAPRMALFRSSISFSIAFRIFQPILNRTVKKRTRMQQSRLHYLTQQLCTFA